TTAQGATADLLSSVVLLPYARYNAILVAAPQARMEEIIKQIRQFDKPIPEGSKLVSFPLKKASAATVANLIQNLYNQRYAAQETLQTNQVRLTADDRANVVYVQASPADMEDIRDLIHKLDTADPEGIRELRLVPLKNGLADEVSNLI